MTSKAADIRVKKRQQLFSRALHLVGCASVLQVNGGYIVQRLGFDAVSATANASETPVGLQCCIVCMGSTQKSMNKRMTAERWAQIDALLNRVLALQPDARVRFIEGETAADADLRAEVLSLLTQMDTRDDVLDRSALLAFARTTLMPQLEEGERIGAFRIVSLLGHGGMGEVYRAERADGQFEQAVALKLLRRDAVDHVDRFIAERQILARLEHPGIARLYDAGVASDGRPYMVMELVDGRPVSEWCEAERPTLTERLDLFMKICDAVAYAHRNLVIHRDLKPANVLVTRDGKAKLLDFGVAKLLSATVDETRNTPLTLAYAAPEQLTHGTMTTATDIYSLGVLLFELVTGERPWATERLPMAVALNKILDEPAPLPSQIASANQNAIDSRRLVGDLDAIVSKALRKTPTDRYASAAELQADIRRYLQGDAVNARGGAKLYVLGRFARRYRWTVAAIASLILALAAGLAGTAWQAREAARERDIARTEAARSDAVRDYVMLMFREAGEDSGEGEITAKQVLERSAEKLLSEPTSARRDEIFQVLGELFAAMDDYEGAAPIFRSYLQTQPNADPLLLAEVRHDLAIAEFRLGNVAQARRELSLAQSFWKQSPERYRSSLASSRVIESQLLRDAGDIDGAIATLRAGLSERIAISGRGHRETAYVMNALALALMDAGQLQEADRLLEQSLQIMAALGKQDSANALTMLSNQAVIAVRLGDAARAEPLFKRAVELRRRLYGRSAALAALQQNLGRVMVRSGRAQQARPLLEDALLMAQEFAGERSLVTLTIMLSVAEVQLATSSPREAESMLHSALQGIAAQFDSNHVLYARGLQLEARLRMEQHRLAEARRAIDESERKLKALGVAGAPYLPEIEVLRAKLAQG